MKFPLLAALEVIRMTTSSATRDGNGVQMTTVSFQCMDVLSLLIFAPGYNLIRG